MELTIVAQIGILLLATLGGYFISKKSVLLAQILLIAAGIGIARYQEIVPDIAKPLTIILLIMILFDTAARWKLHHTDTIAKRAFETSLITTSIALLIFPIAVTWLLWNIPSVSITGIILALFLVETSMSHCKNKKIQTWLNEEAKMSAPFILLIIFILAEILHLKNLAPLSIVTSLGMFIALGAGVGIVIGMITIRMIKKATKGTPFLLILASGACYSIAFLVDGSPEISVIFFGLFYGNCYVKKKDQLIEFSKPVATITSLMVFFLVGWSVPLPPANIIGIAGILFVFGLLIRRGVLTCTASKNKGALTFCQTKGIVLAVVILVLYPLIPPAAQLGLPILFYSMIVSGIAMWYYEKVLS